MEKYRLDAGRNMSTNRSTKNIDKEIETATVGLLVGQNQECLPQKSTTTPSLHLSKNSFFPSSKYFCTKLAQAGNELQIVRS